MDASHVEGALERVRKIITIARMERAPITRAEAFEHIVEEMELAGLGSPEPPDRPAEPRAFR